MKKKGKIRVVLDLEVEVGDPSYFGGSKTEDGAVVWNLITTLEDMNLGSGTTITKADYLQYVVNPAHETVKCDALHPVLAASILDEPLHSDPPWLDKAVECTNADGTKALFLKATDAPKAVEHQSEATWIDGYQPYVGGLVAESDVWKEGISGVWHYASPTKYQDNGWDLTPLLGSPTKKSQVYTNKDLVAQYPYLEANNEAIAIQAYQEGYRYIVSHQTFDKEKWPPMHFPVYKIIPDGKGTLKYASVSYGELED